MRFLWDFYINKGIQHKLKQWIIMEFKLSN